MTQPQPNERAVGLRIALDMARTRRAIAGKMNGVCGDLDAFANGGVYQLNQLIDALQDQLLEAGGFLGDAPEPEEKAFILDRNGAVMAFYDVDELDPDLYAERYAQEQGFDIDETGGAIPDGCEDFSVKIAETPDAVRCWTSKNYMMKAE